MKRFFLTVIMLALAGIAFSHQVPDSSGQTGGQLAAAHYKARDIDAAQLLSDVQTLASDAMEGRQAGTAGGARAREFVVRRFQESGIKPWFASSYLQTFSFRARPKGETREGTNIVGEIKGRTNPQRYIVVTAHYDHLGTRGGKIYNGADDNASGVAALLQVAAYFKRHQPANTLIFAALDAEEEGERGAEAFVESLVAAKRNVVLNVNMDMVSHNDRNELYAVGTAHYPFLKPYIERVAASAPVKLLAGHDRPQPTPQEDWTTQSDHFAFHKAKIPFIYFGVEDHRDYHKPTDDFDTITPDFFTRAAETILDAVKLFDSDLSAIEKQR